MTVTETSPTETTAGYQFRNAPRGCSCDTCPCWIGEDPDEGYLQPSWPTRSREAGLRGVDVSGLLIVGVVHIPGNVLEGNWRRRRVRR